MPVYLFFGQNWDAQFPTRTQSQTLFQFSLRAKLLGMIGSENELLYEGNGFGVGAHAELAALKAILKRNVYVRCIILTYPIA